MHKNPPADSDSSTGVPILRTAAANRSTGSVLAYTSGVVFFVNVDPGVATANAYDPSDNPCGIVAGLVGADGGELEVRPEEISVVER